MKKLFKSAFCLTLAVCLMLALSAVALADPTITFDGNSRGFEFKPGSEYTDTDMFDNFKNVMPGDVLTEEITFTNNATDCDYVKLYMRAEPHNAQNGLTYSETHENADGKDQANVAGERDETVESMNDFLSQLSMKIWNGDQLIYESSPDKSANLTENTLLGTFKKGDKATLRVELTVPKTMGNDYANRVGEVDWVFHADQYKDGKLIQTGQNYMPIFIFGGAGLVLLAVGGVLIFKKKRSDA